jgi:pseudomonalisin
MHRHRLIALGAVLCLGGLTLPAVASGGGPRLVQVASLLRGLAADTDRGPTDPATPVSVAITLSRPDTAGELATYQALYDPTSPSYRHFLTPAQFTERFGVSQERYDAARTWATSTGLSVWQSSAPRDVVQLRGTAAQAQKLFGVALHDFSRPAEPVRFYANTSAASVPAGLGITGVVGLNSHDRSHVTSSQPHSSIGQHVAGTRVPGQDGCDTTLACTGLTTPQDLWSIYDMPNTNFGSGQDVAVFGEGKTDPVIKDLRRFETVHGLRRVNVTVIPTDDDFKDNSGAIEWNLDTQAINGMAPDIGRIALYFGKDLSDASVLSVFTRWSGDATGPLTANASYSECEQAPGSDVYNATPLPVGTAGDAYTKASEATLRMATMLGKTLFSSTGDTGGSCYYGGANVNGVANTVVPLVGYPASSRYAVAAGGTVLYDDNPAAGAAPKRTLEYAWPFTGGGTSSFQAAGAYQGGSPGIAPGTCLSSPDGSSANTGKQCRGVPDVAAQSGDVTGNGYAITYGGSDTVAGGGTSLSSPLLAGMWARINAAAPAASGLGFANETFYAQAKKSDAIDARDFFDVGGVADSLPSGNGQFPAIPRTPGVDPTGWDFVSGLGVPDVANLMKDATGSLVPTHPRTPLPIPDLFAPCDPTGVINDAAGDALSVAGLVDLPFTSLNDPGLDIIKATIDYASTSGRLTFRVKMASLKDALYPGQFIRDDFSFAGKKYELQLQNALDGTKSYTLVNPPSAVGGSTVTTIGALDGGAFDTAASEIRASFTAAAFNAAAKPSSPLGAASVLTDLSILAQRPVRAAGSPGILLTADSADNGGCSANLRAVAAAPTVGSGSPVRAAGPKPHRKATKMTAAKAVVVSRPSSLAATGLPVGLGVVAVGLTGVGLLGLRRRRV